MKKLFIALALCLTCYALVAQDLIKPINGKSFFADIQSVENGVVNYQIGVSKMTIPTTDIALIEFHDSGVQYFHKEALQTINPKTIAPPVYKKGHKVYIPFSSKDETQRIGALKFRELMEQDGTWEVVDCKEEAHFLLEFLYSEQGRDHANVVMKEQSGKVIVQTPKVKNSGRNPKTKGEMLAKAQYDKYVDKMASGKLEFEDGHLFLSGRRNAFVLRPELTSGYGIETDGVIINPSLSVGYQFNPYFFLGVNSGLNSIPFGWNRFKGLMAVPVYGNLRVYFCDKPWSPFFDLKAGYNFPLNFKHYDDYYYDDRQITKLLGFCANATLGLETKHFDFGLNVGTNGIHIDEYYYGQFDYYRYDLILGISIAYNIQIR